MGVVHQGKLPGELTLVEVAGLWRLSRSRVYQLVVERGVVPYRKDYYRYYVRLKDAANYKHVSKRGRPRLGEKRNVYKPGRRVS